MMIDRSTLNNLIISHLFALVIVNGSQMAEEEARQQLQKNVESNIEQVLAATPHKAPTIQPPASHHENYTR